MHLGIYFVVILNIHDNKIYVTYTFKIVKIVNLKTYYYQTIIDYRHICQIYILKVCYKLFFSKLCHHLT